MDYNGFCQNFLKSWLRSFCFRESLANDFEDTVDADESVFEDEMGQKKKKPSAKGSGGKVNSHTGCLNKKFMSRY